MTRTRTRYVSAFRQAGLKITPQRRRIFTTLAAGLGHPTAEEVYRQAKRALPDISRSTVYNTLHTLVELGKLALVEDITGGGARYDTHSADHHHLYCLRCGAIVDLPEDVARPQLTPEMHHGYRIVRRQVTFYGYCPACRSTEPESADL